MYEKSAVFSTRGIPKAIIAGEVDDSSPVPAKIIQARIGYTLKDSR